jgi:FkbM family methyltransferase
VIRVDPLALGSDVPRSRRQYWRRKFAKAVVSMLRLNRCGPLATEIVQAIDPVLSIETKHGRLLCRGGHGRLVWRAATFHTEEPKTIRWLDSIGVNDCYWDIGANVGLYAIYVAKFRGCGVFAFEPEAQNYALLIENMVLNDVDIDAMPLAIHDRPSLGNLQMPYLTKGGAYNNFNGAVGTNGGHRQRMFGTSVDDLVNNYGLPYPTHLKIDVDGNEPMILEGASKVLKSARSLLVEIDKSSPEAMGIFDILKAEGFKVASDSPALRRDVHTANVIFSR